MCSPTFNFSFTLSDSHSVLSLLYFTSPAPLQTVFSHRGKFRCLVAAKVKNLKTCLTHLRLSLSFSHCLQVSGINSSMSRKREQHVLFMVVIMVICYLLCWLPYGIMALLATFGPPGFVTPEASIIPSVLAKLSTVINPVIYVFMNKQVRVGGREAEVSAFYHLLSRSRRQRSPRITISFFFFFFFFTKAAFVCGNESM